MCHASMVKHLGMTNLTYDSWVFPDDEIGQLCSLKLDCDLNEDHKLNQLVKHLIDMDII